MSLFLENKTLLSARDSVLSETNCFYITSTHLDSSLLGALEEGDNVEHQLLYLDSLSWYRNSFGREPLETNKPS